MVAASCRGRCAMDVAEIFSTRDAPIIRWLPFWDQESLKTPKEVITAFPFPSRLPRLIDMNSPRLYNDISMIDTGHETALRTL